MAWSANQYSLFEDERTRAVRDLLAAIPPRPVRHATDLGCGPGNSTEVLLQRYPDAQVTALDSDPDMIDKARERKRLCIPRVRTVIADIAGWSAPEPQDLILANASLQWVPDHASLYPHLVRQLSEGASLAVQTPTTLTNRPIGSCARLPAKAPGRRNSPISSCRHGTVRRSTTTCSARCVREWMCGAPPITTLWWAAPKRWWSGSRVRRCGLTWPGLMTRSRLTSCRCTCRPCSATTRRLPMARCCCRSRGCS